MSGVPGRAWRDNEVISGQFRDRAREEDGWTLHMIDSTHSPNITAPWTLFGLVQQILEG